MLADGTTAPEIPSDTQHITLPKGTPTALQVALQSRVPAVLGFTSHASIQSIACRSPTELTWKARTILLWVNYPTIPDTASSGMIRPDKNVGLCADRFPHESNTPPIVAAPKNPTSTQPHRSIRPPCFITAPFLPSSIRSPIIPK